MMKKNKIFLFRFETMLQMLEEEEEVVELVMKAKGPIQNVENAQTMPNVNNKEAAVIAIEVITTNRKTTTLLIIQILIMIVIVLIVHQPVVKTLVQKVMSNLRQVIIVIPPVRSLVYPDKSSPKGDKAPSLSHSNNSDMTRHDEDLLSQENCGASENHFHDFRGGGGG